MCLNLSLSPAPDPPAELQGTPEPEERPACVPVRGLALAWPGLKHYLMPLWRGLHSALQASSLAVLRVLGNYPK